jgi:hypothetical protein
MCGLFSSLFYRFVNFLVQEREIFSLTLENKTFFPSLDHFRPKVPLLLSNACIIAVFVCRQTFQHFHPYGVE